jgi:hypothetical protein
MMVGALFYSDVPAVGKAPSGTHSLNFDTVDIQSPQRSLITKDEHFQISISLSNGQLPETFMGDYYGLLIEYVNPDTTSVTVYLEVKATGTWDFAFKEAMIGEVSITEKDNDFTNIMLTGYRGASQVCQTSPYNSIGILEDVYSIDYSNCADKQMDRFVFQFTIPGKGITHPINFASFTIVQNSTIIQESLSFDKNEQLPGYNDVTVNYELHGNTLMSVKLNGSKLSYGTTYTSTINTVTLKKEFLKDKPNGVYTITLEMNQGEAPQMSPPEYN